ncbi:MAG: TlpA family protein disulfide reductase [Mycobacterium leprae]
MTVEQIRYPAYKRITSAIILGLMVFWAGYLLLWPTNPSKAAGTGIAIGKPAPDFELKTVDGQSMKLSDLKGKAVILNFFATWCPSCKEETPLLQQTYQDNQRNLVVLAVDLDESDVAIKAYQTGYHVTYPIVIDKNDRVMKQYDIVPLPTTYFIDKNGIVRDRWTGGITKAKMPALLKKILP